MGDLPLFIRRGRTSNDLKNVTLFAPMLFIVLCPISAIAVKDQRLYQTPIVERLSHYVESKRRPAVHSGAQLTDFHLLAHVVVYPLQSYCRLSYERGCT